MASVVRLSSVALRSTRLTALTRHSFPPSAVIIQSAQATTSPAKEGSGGKHWKYERVATVALLGLIPAGFIYPSPVVDYGLAVLIPLHGHWGFESILEDYTRQSLKKFMYPLLYCISLGTFVGLMYLNVTDVGICNAVKILWSLK